LIASEYNASVICLTESWLSAVYPDAFLGLQNSHNVFRKDKNESVGGGVCALVAKHLSCSQVQLELNDVHTIDLLVFDVAFQAMKVRFILCYRPPKSSEPAVRAFNNVLNIISDCINCTWPTIMLGDFNLPDIDWAAVEAHEQRLHEPFINFVCENGFTQYVCEPTRKHNILDLVLCNDEYFISDCDVIAPIGTSDHCGVHFSVPDGVNASGSEDVSPPHVLGYDFANADYDSINKYLSGVDWQGLLANDHNTQSMWDSFNAVVKVAIDAFVPLRNFPLNRKSDVKLYPKYIRRLFSKKLTAWHRFKHFGTPKLKERYESCSRECQLAVDGFINDRESALINSDNVGRFYRYVNNKIVSKSGVAPLKDSNGVLLTDDHSKADTLSNYFGSVFTVDDNQIKCVSLSSDVNNDPQKLSDINFSIDDVYRILRKLKPKNSKGPDGYSAVFLKNLASSIAFPLTILFNESFCTGTIPSVWKQAMVVPSFKKGLASDPNNYRPISLTCICCKVMESVIKEQTLKFLLKNNKITKQQHGFLARHSTCTELLESTNEWLLKLNSKSSVDVIYIDFRRAFDSVVHSKLLYKLQNIGICGKLLCWIAAFLSGRSQSVVVGDSVSNSVPVISGVPQGSVLGPLLFLVFINDLCDIFGPDIKIKLFADDAKIYMSINNILDHEVLQHGLYALSCWAEIWQLQVSVPKCSVLHLGNRNNGMSYDLNGIILPDVKSMVDLGLTIDSNLRYKLHINNIVSKAHQRACLIMRCFKSRDPILLFRAFCVYVRPLVEYCVPVWSPSYIADINKVEAVQRRFTKRLFNFRWLSYRDRLLKLNADSLELRRLQLCLTMIFKILHGFVAIDAQSIFTMSSTCTRGHNFKIEKPLPKVNCFMHSFACRDIQLWNSLPVDVVNARNVVVFKSLLDKQDFNKYLYAT